MKIIFSRKGFDSTSGGAPSPIIDGVPYSLPIPTDRYPSASTYRHVGLGDALSKVKSKSKVDDPCHEDPMFWDDRCAFGQTSTAQSHLKGQDVRTDDVFLFFGLFAELGSNDRHHRIFGYLKVEGILDVGARPRNVEIEGAPRQHPHTIEKWNGKGKWDDNNTIYLGRGGRAKKAYADLRLTKPGGPASHWVAPKWLRKYELTYHQNPKRWCKDGTLRSASPGQEFIADVGDRPEPKEWLDGVLALIEAGP
jgi:hypothetical protein